MISLVSFFLCIYFLFKSQIFSILLAIFHSFYVEFMLTTHEDDTKSFRMIARIYDILVLHNGVHWHEFNQRWKVASSVKKALEDRVLYFFSIILHHVLIFLPL